MVTSARLRGRVGGLTRQALTNGLEATRRAREVAAKRLHDRLVALVDPNGRLGPDEHAYRMHQAKRAHFAGLALRSAVARRKASKRARTALRGTRGRSAS